MNLRQYTKADIADKRVILRADLDVGVNEQGAVDEFDDLRLRRAARTIKELLRLGAAQTVIIGHRGRPHGQVDLAFSLQPVRDRLAALLGEAVSFAAEAAVKLPRAAARLVMLENLRFWPGEEANDRAFAETLAHWGEIYANDAFSNSHRRHASMAGLPQITARSFAGPGLANEIKHLSEFTENPVHPYVAVLGGAKIETKLPLIKNLLTKAEIILLGGGLANTFFKARGWEISQSLVDEPFLATARSLASEKLLLPLDVVITDSGGVARTVPATAVPPDGFIGDIGPETVKLYTQKIAEAKMILYNGPMGKFEEPAYQAGTRSIIAAITESGARILTGGGDTISVIEQLGLTAKFGFVSVGGGAMLTFLAGAPMPALEALKVTN